MNWQARSLDPSGWQGIRKFELDDVLQLEEVRRVVIPRLCGTDTLRKLMVKLNDACAEFTTPYWKLVLYCGSPGYDLLDALTDIIDDFNDEVHEKGIKLRLVEFGLANYASFCSGALKGDQPEFWVRFDTLSDRLMQENREFDRRRKSSEQQPQEE